MHIRKHTDRRIHTNIQQSFLVKLMKYKKRGGQRGQDQS